jgi:glycosyltransferase involved in cell wall biosynthesis
MAFHGLLVIRDESDIIGETLRHVLTWADGVYVFDTGSTDGTWEIVNELAQRDRRVVPFMRQPVYWHLGLRALLFDRFRDRFRRGDWIVRLDADEMYHIAPQEFARSRVSRAEGRVRSLMFEFVLTRSMVEADRASTGANGGSIVDRRRVYYIDPHPEVRMFRYRPSMRWTPDRDGPFDEGLMAYERIPVRHYRCRDEAQVKKRCALRTRMRRGQPVDQPRHTFAPVTHWAEDDWEYWVWPDDSPRLRRWDLGADLPEFRSPRLARGTWARLRSQLKHGVGAPVLFDRFRTRYPTDYMPEPIPEEIQAQLAAAVGGVSPPC